MDGELVAKVNRAAEASLKRFPRLTPDNLSLSVIDRTKPDHFLRADYHGDASFYPASLVKLFYMTAAFHRGGITPEMKRALEAMIRFSDNDAAAYVVDVVTGTTSGPELEGKSLEEFLERRRSLNRYFSSLGYDVSVFIKPWSFGPFGREMQIMGENKVNRNRSSANSVASLLCAIVDRRAISRQASEQMLALLERPLAPMRADENQVKEFLGEALPAGAKLWSKAADTSEVRHDAAYVELPSGRKYIIVILTRGAADDPTLLPGISRQLLNELRPARGRGGAESSGSRVIEPLSHHPEQCPGRAC